MTDTARIYAFATATSAKAYHWTPVPALPWEGFVAWLKLDSPWPLKGTRCFVGGTLVETTGHNGAPDCVAVHRNRAGVVSRSMVALDADFADATFIDRVRAALGDIAWVAYTTWKSSPDAPRWRLIVPLSRDVEAEDYWLISNAMAQAVGVDFFDRSTYQHERLMNAPCTPPEAREAYTWEQGEGPAADVDAWRAVGEERGVLARGEIVPGVRRAADPDWVDGEPTAEELECAGNVLRAMARTLAALEPGQGRANKLWGSLVRLYRFGLGGFLDVDVVDDVMLEAVEAQPEGDASHEQTWAVTSRRAWQKAQAEGPLRPVCSPGVVAGSAAEEDWGVDVVVQQGVEDAADMDLLGLDEVAPEIVAEAAARREYDRLDIASDHQMGRRVAYEHLDGTWMAWGKSGWAKWDGRRWDVQASVDEVNGVVQDALIAIQRDATRRADRERDARLARGENWSETMKWHRGQLAVANRLRTKKTLDDIRTSARPHLRTDLSAFDGPEYTWLFNCANGMIDLRTGELLPHSSSMLVTKVSPVKYRPGATHADWDKILNAIPEDVRPWAQRWFGRGLVGAKPADDSVLYMHGGGENGKSTFLLCMGWVLGDYATTVSPKVLSGNSGDHSTEFMPLRGARMAWIEELPGGDWLSGTALKKAEGPDSGMTARWIGENNVTWTPTHSLVFTSNNEIAVTDTDHGTRRRLVKMTFPWKFGEPGMPRDPSLKDRLKDRRNAGVAEAALAWLVVGAVAGRDGVGVQREDRPERIAEDTREWLARGNPVEAFFEECLELALGDVAVAGSAEARGAGMIRSSEVYQDYIMWSKMRGRNRPLGDAAFWQQAKTTALFSAGADKKPTRTSRGTEKMLVGAVWASTWVAEKTGL